MSKASDRKEYRRRILVWLTTVTDVAKVRQMCVETLGISERTANSLIADARIRLASSAKFDRDEEVGRTVAQLDHLYTEAIGAKDYSQALRIVERRMKLRGLASETERETAAPSDAVLAELALIRAYLDPLALGDENTPTAELARRAVAKLAE